MPSETTIHPPLRWETISDTEGYLWRDHTKLGYICELRNGTWAVLPIMPPWRNSYGHESRRVAEAVMERIVREADDAARLRTVAVSIDPCLEKREPDEPMFILLGRDSAAPKTIEAWCRQREIEIGIGLRPDTDDERNHIQQVRAKAFAFREWRSANRAARDADMTREAGE